MGQGRQGDDDQFRAFHRLGKGRRDALQADFPLAPVV